MDPPRLRTSELTLIYRIFPETDISDQQRSRFDGNPGIHCYMQCYFDDDSTLSKSRDLEEVIIV